MHITPLETRREILALLSRDIPVAEIAQIAKVNRATVRRYRDQGDVGYVKPKFKKCRKCGIDVTDLPFAKDCPEHRAQGRASSLEREHYTVITYIPTDEIDAAIRAVFTEKKGTLTGTAKRFRWSYHALRRRAEVLGYSRPLRNPIWTEAEIQILIKNAHLSTISVWRKLRRAGFQRSESAIKSYFAKNRLRSESREYYTAQSLADGFGVSYSVITRWIKLDYLPAQRREAGLADYGEDGRDPWMIRPKDVKKFVFEYPLQFDIRKVDQLWFLELVSGGLRDLTKPESSPQVIDDDADDVLSAYQIGG